MTEAPEASTASPSIGQMVGDIAQDFSVMLRAEARLAQMEVRRNLSRIKPALIALGFAALLGAAALVVLLMGVATLLHPLLGAGFAEILLAKREWSTRFELLDRTLRGKHETSICHEGV